ncbi:MAG: FlgD immunoglobulin-like domain containing protein [Candidatus Krumholzibacteriia bacterium]
MRTDSLYSDSCRKEHRASFCPHHPARPCLIATWSTTARPCSQFTAVALLGYYSAEFVTDGVEITGSQTGVYLVHTESDLSGVHVLADPAAAIYNHGVVCVGALGAKSALDTPLWPEPAPLAADGPPPGRPQQTWSVRLRDLTLDGAGSPSSRGLGMRSVDAEPLQLSAERCTITRWDSGVFGLDDGVGRVRARLSGCRIQDNQSYGVFANTQDFLDARGSWWGDATGPFHPTKNPLGLGNTVSDRVLFNPWLRGNLAPLPWPQTISLADLDGTAYRDTVQVDFLGGGSAPLYGHSTEVHWNPAVATLVEISRPASGAFADAVLFQVLPLTGGMLIDSALGGDQPGIASGPLFRMVFEAVGAPDFTVTPIDLTLRHARDRYNQSIVGLVEDDGSLVVDLQPPVITSLSIENLTLPHTNAYAKNGDQLAVSAAITDGDPAFGAEQIRGTGAALFGYLLPYEPPDVYLAPLALWASRPAALSPADGEAGFWVEAWDPSGNIMAQVSTSLIADNTPPLAPTGLVAAAVHNAVNVSWDDPTGTDLNFRRLQLRANPWQDYPFYDGGDPGYPATVAAGLGWYAGGGTSHVQTFAADGSGRDIFYLSAIVEDMAGNQSPVGGGNRARTLNYILGDVRGTAPATPGDGTVTIHDITRLGDTFGLIRTDPGFDGECDIAPATAGPNPIPVPDEEVGYDDLMIMAGQFDPVPGALPAPPGPANPQLAWRSPAAGVWVLELLAPCPRLKGVHLAGLAPAGVAVQVAPGALVDLQTSPVFVHGGRGPFEASLAVLGRGIGLEGSGELLRLTAPAGAPLPTPLLDLRDVDNQPLVCNLPTAVAPDDVPAVFRSALPSPNPFNPSTMLAFDLPAAQSVRLMVYTPDGKRVTTLVDEDLPAGRHQARWTGRDTAGRPVAAGTYLYRLQAGPWSATGKLELVK